MNTKKELQIQHDGLLVVSTEKSRHGKNWKNKEVLWSVLIDRLSKPLRTQETMAEYHNMSRDAKSDRKDVGGYVGGSLKGGRRTPENVVWRQLCTLDIDFPVGDVAAGLEILWDHGYVLHSTHSSRPRYVRLRLIVPTNRPMTPDEYEPTCRRLAADIGIDMFDNTTYELARLMYWPSIPTDAEYIFKVVDGPWLDVDATLARYPDWKDSSYWPESSKVDKARKRSATKQGNPLEKTGVIGAFCRTYSVEAVLETFLADVYEPGAEGRYTYLAGSAANGLVAYDDGKFVYSHHSTDPIGQKLVNAFDLARIHLFGLQDEDAAEGTPTVKLPSYLAMQDFCLADNETKRTLGAEKLAGAREDFADDAAAEGDDWLKQLGFNKRGDLDESLPNMILILRHDATVKGIAYNSFHGATMMVEKMPWRGPATDKGPIWTDADDSNLRGYMSVAYKMYAPAKLADAISIVAHERSYHPVKEYLESLPAWDRVERLDTLLVRYGGAEDSAYTRAVTRKTLVGAVKRIMQPGCKCDHMLVLNGRQGIGKSTLFARLGGDYFNDSLSMADAKDKTAAEKLQGYWILEISELAGLKRAELEAVKGFLSRQKDVYRPSYGRRTEEHPRQCIIVGSTNNDLGFLRDPTGNRRFWPVNVQDVGEDKAAWHMTNDEVAQVWAEAVKCYAAGETLFLSGEEATEAARQQNLAMETDERLGLIQDYLERLLPAGWDNWEINDRRGWLRGNDFGDGIEGTVRRDVVSVAEIWTELFCRDLATSKRHETDEIHSLMKRIPGWEKYPSKGGKTRFKLYGVQRAYSRIIVAEG